MFKNVKKFFVLLCILNFFSCKGMDGDSFKKILNQDNSEQDLMTRVFTHHNKKEPKKQISMLILGAVISLLAKGTVNVLSKVVPVSIKPWIEDVSCSLSIGTKEKELRLSNNIYYTSLFALYVISDTKNSVPYKLEMALGFFVISPLITTTYHYITKTKDKNLQK